MDQAKGYLPPKQAKRNKHLSSSFMFAVAEVSSKLMESHRVAKVTVNITSGDREITLSGLDSDLSQIYYLLYGAGDTQEVLEHIDLAAFLKDHNSSDASAGIPSKFAFVNSDDDGITIRFNVPAEGSTTMEVWYFRDMDVNAMRDAKGPALLNLTIGYFHGVGTEAGAPYYGIGRGLIGDIRANAKPVRDEESQFVSSRFDRSVKVTRASMRNRR
ncbi:MAG: hypothetical protein KAR42_17630 [candidate division Zixibacteria bacterium]|nr:hypothetical protein [candidate division Zixibacteria bacterium]